MTDLFGHTPPPVKRKGKDKRRPKPGKLLECLYCTLRYTEERILAGAYQTDTMICSACYADEQRKPHAESCFGKPTFIIMPGGRKLLGYSSTAFTCTRICPDREICKRIVIPG